MAPPKAKAPPKAPPKEPGQGGSPAPAGPAAGPASREVGSPDSKIAAVWCLVSAQRAVSELKQDKSRHLFGTVTFLPEAQHNPA